MQHVRLFALSTSCWKWKWLFYPSKQLTLQFQQLPVSCSVSIGTRTYLCSVWFKRSGGYQSSRIISVCVIICRAFRGINSLVIKYRVSSVRTPRQCGNAISSVLRLYTLCLKNVQFLKILFWTTLSKIIRFLQFLVHDISMKLDTRRLQICPTYLHKNYRSRTF